jgi:hypothetical protein
MGILIRGRVDRPQCIADVLEDRPGDRGHPREDRCVDRRLERPQLCCLHRHPLTEERRCLPVLVGGWGGGDRLTTTPATGRS